MPSNEEFLMPITLLYSSIFWMNKKHIGCITTGGNL